jgi:hypothetical protein
MSIKGRNKSRTQNIVEASAVGSAAAGAALAAYDANSYARKKKAYEKNQQQKRQARSQKIKAKTNVIKTKTAKMELGRITKINPKDLSTQDRKIRKELIKRQKDIIKGAKPQTLAKSAAKLGLRSIPGVGAFITAFSSKPAGQGSALTGPGSKRK